MKKPLRRELRGVARQGLFLATLTLMAFAPRMAQAAIQVTPWPIDFGDVAVGEYRDLTVSFMNASIATNSSFEAIWYEPGTVFTVQEDHCTHYTLPPGTSCSIVLRAQPHAVGTDTGTLNLVFYTDETLYSPGLLTPVNGTAQPQVPHGTAAFTFTGTDQTFTVPSGATFVDVDMWGAGGEFGTADLGGLDCEWMPGGGGGYVSVRIYTTPGEQLTVRVGGAASNTTGGWPNGGNGYLDAIRMGRRTYVFGMYGGGGGSSSIRRNGTVIAEVGGGNGGLPCLLPIGGGYYEWPDPCNPVGNQRGTDWIGTGEAGGGGYCGGGPGNPSRSGAHYGFTPAQANGEVPGAVEHPLREGAGEGGFWASPTPGRVSISWVASPEPPPVTDATVTGTWDNTATLTECGYGCGTYVGYVYHFPLVLQQDTATTFLGTYDQVPIVGSITGNAITFGWTGYQTSLGPSDGTCTGTISGSTMSFTCSGWIAGQLNGTSTNIALRTGP